MSAVDVVAVSPVPGTLRFLYAYIVRRGFLDGRAGWQYARMLTSYQRFIDINMAELRRASSADGL